MRSKLNYLIICFAFFAFASVSAQDTLAGLRQEFYISLTDFSPLSINLKYKKQTRPKTYFKIGLVSLSANVYNYNNNLNGTTFPVGNENYSGGLEVGIEFRRSLTKKLSFFHGPALRGIYQYSLNKNYNPSIPQYQQKNKTDMLTGAIPYTFGLLFQVHNNFYGAIEINPAVSVSYQTNENNAGQKGYNVSGGFMFDNRYALLSLVYRY